MTFMELLLSAKLGSTSAFEELFASVSFLEE